MQRTAPDARILKLRDYEETLAYRKRAVQVSSLAELSLSGSREALSHLALQEGERLGQVAAWEEKTDERIHNTNVARIFGQLCAQREADIDQRRRALAVKLQQESQLLQLELVASEVSCILTSAHITQNASAKLHAVANCLSIAMDEWGHKLDGTWFLTGAHVPLITQHPSPSQISGVILEVMGNHPQGICA